MEREGKKIMDRSSIVVTYDGDLDTLFENADKALMLMDAQDIKYDYHKHVLYASVPIGGNKTPFALHLMMVSSRQLQITYMYDSQRVVRMFIHAYFDPDSYELAMMDWKTAEEACEKLKIEIDRRKQALAEKKKKPIIKSSKPSARTQSDFIRMADESKARSSLRHEKIKEVASTVYHIRNAEHTRKFEKEMMNQSKKRHGLLRKRK